MLLFVRLDAIRRLKLRIGSIGEIQHTFISDRVTNTAQIVCTATGLQEKRVKPDDVLSSFFTPSHGNLDQNIVKTQFGEKS